MIWCSLKSAKWHWLAKWTDSKRIAKVSKYFSCIYTHIHIYSPISPLFVKKTNPHSQFTAIIRPMSAFLGSIELPLCVCSLYHMCVYIFISIILYRRKSTKEPNNLVDDSIDLSINHFLEIERTLYSSFSSFFFFIFSSFPFFFKRNEKNPCKIQKSTTLLLYVMPKYVKHAIANHIRYIQTIQIRMPGCMWIWIYECGYRYGCVCVCIDVILFVS